MLPHDEARASIMEHAIRAQINERLADNPVFFGKLSARLAQIIEALRNRLIDSAEACRRYAAVRHEIRREAEIAAEHGLSPVSFAIYELLDSQPYAPGAAAEIREEQAPYRTRFDEATKDIAPYLRALPSSAPASTVKVGGAWVGGGTVESRTCDGGPPEMICVSAVMAVAPTTITRSFFCVGGENGREDRLGCFIPVSCPS